MPSYGFNDVVRKSIRILTVWDPEYMARFVLVSTTLYKFTMCKQVTISYIVSGYYQNYVQ